MLSIFFVTIFLWFLFASAGCAFFYLLRHEPSNLFLSFFIGLFCVSLLGLLVSLFMPLNVYALFICFVPSLLGCALLSKYLYRLFHNNKLNKCIFVILGVFSLVCIFSFASSDAIWTGWAYDADLYHIQIIRWLNEYAGVPGLGNLHSRLANTSTWLIIAALLNNFVINGSAAWYMMPLFLSAFSAYYLYDVLCSDSIYIRVYSACILPVCVYAVRQWGYPNLYHDFPSLATTCIIGSEVIRLLYNKAPNKNGFICTAILITLAFLLKPLPVVTVLCVTAFLLYIARREKLLTLRFTCTFFALPVCAALLWCIRNIVFSGYPVFPMTLISFDVDWRMIESAVADNAHAVRAWARMPGAQYREAFERGITFWFIPWLYTIIKSKFLIFQIFVPLGIGSFCWFLVRKSFVNIENVFLFIWPTLSIVYWFWLAPDPRFGVEYFWLFFALGAVSLVRNRLEIFQAVCDRIPFSGRRGTTIYVSCVIVCMMLGSLQFHWKNGHWSNVAWIKTGIVPARPVVKKSVIHHGRAPFTVNIVADGDRCGNAPLPCTPYFNPNLEMRVDGNLGAGFRMRR